MSGHGVTTISSFLKHAAYTIKVPRRSYTQPSSKKLFSRGGRNLSERFQRLEKTFRTKHDLDRITASRPLTPLPPTAPPRLSTVTTFRGVVIPEVPRAPESDGLSFTRFPATVFVLNNLVECCMSGCAICVHDLYQESLDGYNDSVVAVRASLTDMKIPEEEWPETVRPGSEKRMSPASSLGAFQEMERALKARREAQAQS